MQSCTKQQKCHKIWTTLSSYRPSSHMCGRRFVPGARCPCVHWFRCDSGLNFWPEFASKLDPKHAQDPSTIHSASAPPTCENRLHYELITLACHANWMLGKSNSHICEPSFNVSILVSGWGGSKATELLSAFTASMWKSSICFISSKGDNHNIVVITSTSDYVTRL